MPAFFKSERMMAIVERDLRKFFRSPALMMAACKNVRAHLEKLKTEGLAFDEGEHWKL